MQNLGFWFLYLTKFYIENFSIINCIKKDLLNFLFIRYDFAIIQLLFWRTFLISLFLQALSKVSQGNIFVFFFYIWSFKVNSIFIIIRICFLLLLSKPNINWSFSPSSFSFKLLLLYFIKVLATCWPIVKFF